MQKKKTNLVVIFSLALVNSLVLSKLFLVNQNNLNKSGNWQSTKVNLEKNVMGAQQFMESSISVYKEKLNLGAWHGFQEVIHSQKIDPGLIRFDFFLEENSYFYLIFNKTDEGFSGIRISANYSFPSQYIEANKSGEFLFIEPLSRPIFKAEAWQTAQVAFTTSTLELNTDNISFSVPFDKKVNSSQFGFRGSHKQTYIDNLVVFDTESNIIFQDRFSNYKEMGRIFLASLSILILINILFITYFFLLRKKGGQLAKKTIVFNVIILLCLPQMLAYTYFYQTKQYPTLDSFSLFDFKKIENLEDNWVEREKKVINNKVLGTLDCRDVECSFTKIMFIGSSQTWGAGASSELNTFISLTEEKLNNSTNSGLIKTKDLEKDDEQIDNPKQYKLINTGISGVTSSDLLSIYKTDWISLKPDILIINLSSNDNNPKLFKENLEEFLRLNKENNIKTVFLLEANSTELNPNQLALHPVMIEVAKENNVPYFDLHGYLKKEKESGIIWWDFVHLTDYGHELTAEFLINQVMPNLDIN